MESTIFPTSAIAAVAEDIHFSMLKAAAGRRAESKPYRFFTCRISNGSRLSNMQKVTKWTKVFFL